MKHHVHLVGGNLPNKYGMEHFVAKALEQEDALGNVTSYRRGVVANTNLRVRDLKADILLVIKGELLDPTMIYSAPRYSVFWYQDDIFTKMDSRNDMWNLAWAFNRVYSYDWNALDYCRQLGARSVKWLPCAADPETHAKLDREKEFDVSFVGQPFRKRLELFEKLAKRYERHFFGVDYANYADIVARTKVNLNVGKGDTGIQQRVFEILAMGGFLVTTNIPDNGKLFEDGTHLRYFDDENHLCELIDYYLAHDEERERIAAQGQESVLANHTYRHRVKKILEDYENEIGR